MSNDNRRILTFNVAGPLNGYYVDVLVRDDENDGVDGNGVRISADNVIHAWANEHFPKDWASTYLFDYGEGQVKEYALKLLCKGRIEFFNHKTFFHEERP